MTPAASPETPRRRAPGVMLPRLTGYLDTLLTCGIARRAADDMIELPLTEEEVAVGGMATISMRVAVRCPACKSGPCERCGGKGTVEELFSAWLAIRPGVADGAMLRPTVVLRGMIHPVAFRARHGFPG